MHHQKTERHLARQNVSTFLSKFFYRGPNKDKGEKRPAQYLLLYWQWQIIKAQRISWFRSFSNYPPPKVFSSSSSSINIYRCCCSLCIPLVIATIIIIIHRVNKRGIIFTIAANCVNNSI